VKRYTIWILQADDAFSEVSQCNGADSAVIASRVCQVDMDVLRAEPFSLPLGRLIQVKVTATNDKGTSDDSPLNTVGAVVQFIP
jgi:hypothetical protein